jgi:prepilin-type N-terminal cleavage/methylation domain-containing protein
MLNKKGFTLVELLVVLIIVAILAAIATPLYLQHTKKARISEAIATMSLIRQSERDYKVNHTTYFDVKEDTTKSNTAGNIEKGLPTSVVAATGVPTPDPSGVEINTGVTQYFSNASFFVDADPTPGDITTRSGLFTNPGPQGFLISAKGDNSYACAASTDTACAVHAGDVAGYEAEMDDSGRIFVCYGTCGTAANWGAY